MSTTRDIITAGCFAIGCFTLFKITHVLTDKKPILDMFPKWKNIHQTCRVTEFKDTINSIKREILMHELGDDTPNNVTIVDGQSIIRSHIGRVVIFATKDLITCFNEYTNSDWNCIQDRTTFVLVTQIKSYIHPCEVSIDVELWI